jgi:hypothetical protein
MTPAPARHASGSSIDHAQDAACSVGTDWLRRFRPMTLLGRGTGRPRGGRSLYRPRIECLEDRLVLSGINPVQLHPAAVYHDARHLVAAVEEVVPAITSRPVGQAIALTGSSKGAHKRPVITTQPLSQTAQAGTVARFAAVASGNPTPKVQWQIKAAGRKSWRNIAGATSATLTLTPTMSMSGNQYRAIFHNARGNATSKVAILTVQAQPVGSTQQSPAYVLEGGFLYEVNGKSLQLVVGLSNVTQVAVDSQGQTYALQANGLLFGASGTMAKQVATGVTQIATDPAGEVVALQGPHAYVYFKGQLSLGGSSASSNPGQATQYFLDGQGRLFSVTAGVVSVSTSMSSSWAQIGKDAFASDGNVWFLGTAAVDSAGDHAIYYFSNGQLMQMPTAHALSGAIDAAYNATADLTDDAGRSVQLVLGPATAAPQAVAGVPGASVVPFEGGSLYYSAATGGHALYGAIGAEYAATAQETDAFGASVQGDLGLPTGDEQNVPGAPGEYTVPFQGGQIDWSAATGAHAVYGAIGALYAAQGGASGSLGLPVSEEHAWAGGRLVQFQNGSITWSATTGPAVLGPTYQAVDGNGNTVTYVLQGGGVDEVTANTLNPVAGPGYVTQAVVDGLHRLFALDTNGVLWQVTGLTAQQAGINVTKVAVDSAGEVAMLNGPYAYGYIIGSLSVGGSGITPTGPTQYDLDSQGRLYALANGVLTVTNTSNPTSETLATGVTQFAIDSAGEVAFLKGTTEYDYIAGGLETGGGVVTNGEPVQYALDAEGRLFTLLDGVLTITDTSLGAPRQVATGVTRMAVDSLGEVVILQGSSAYQYFAGLLGSTGTNAGSGPLPQYAVDNQGRFYTLQNGQLTEQDTMSGAIKTVATNVIELGTTPLGQVDYMTANGVVEQSTTTGGWTAVGVSGVTAPDGSGWFLGVTVVDGYGNRDIYRFSNGRASQVPGLADQLQIINGSLSVTTGGGGLSISTSKGLVPIFKNVTGVTAGPSGTYAVSFGSWLKADVSATTVPNSAVVNLVFSNVQINAGPLVDMVNTFVGNLQGMTKPLSQVFTPLTQLPGFSQIMSRAGIKTNITIADLLGDALDATGHSDAANALQQLGSVVQAVDAVPYFPSGSWVNLKGSFTATATGGGAIELGSLPGGDLLQQLGGAYASLASQASGIGVTLPSEATLLGVLLGGNTNVTLLTYTLPKVSATLPVLNQELAVLGMPAPGVTLNAKIVGNLSFNVEGQVSLTASALTSGNLGQSLSFSPNAVFSAGLSIGPAGELDLGVSGLSLVGYQVAGLFNLQASAVFRPDSIVVVPSVTNSVSCHWVGPTLDPSQLGGETVANVDPDILIFELERQAANGLLQQWGLPTIPPPSSWLSSI